MGTEAALLERLQHARAGIGAGQERGSGRLAAQRLSSEADQAVAALWTRLGPTGSSIVATGDLGRRELAPRSVIELVALYRSTPDGGDGNVERAVRALSHRLWTAGVEVSCPVYAVTDPAHIAELARQSVGLQAVFLEGRFLAGDEPLWQAVRDEVLGMAKADPEGFLDLLRRSTAARRAEAGDAAGGLEPDLREGRGGLVDLATIGWIERVIGLPDLPVPRGRLERAADLVQRVRAALHRHAGRATDLLSIDSRKAVSEEVFGTEVWPAAEGELMRTLYEHCRMIASTLDVVLDPAALEPPAVRRFLAALGAEGSGSWRAGALRAFLDLLGTGEDARSGLAALDAGGWLTRAIPEWAAVRCLPEWRSYHRWAVDEHAFRAVAAVAQLAGDPDPSVRSAVADVESDADILLLAALFHDIGKGGEADHAERGAERTQVIVERMGLDEAAAADVVWLVRRHLLLTHVATRRDIGDEVLVADVAARVGTERRLQLLYLLTVVDGRATGPAAWTPWKATLVTRLHALLQQILRGEDGAENRAARVREARDEVRSALSDLPSGPVDRHLAAMAPAWLLSQPASVLAEQSRQMIAFGSGDDVRIHPSPLEGGLWGLLVVALDRPGMFSRIAGVLALHDLSVLWAEAFARRDGVALVVFRLEALSDEPPSFELVAEDARKALSGRLSIGWRLAMRRNDLSATRGSGFAPRVVVDNDASERFSVVEIHAGDRAGLLYAITRALADLELDIKLAKISTYGEDVIDVFYVADSRDRKVTDAGYISEIQASVGYAISGGAMPSRPIGMR
jgi:[protein-PII] uridylyltransferase